MVVLSGGPAIELAHVTENGTIVWQDAGLRALGFQNQQEANNDLVFCRRPHS